MTVQAVGKIAAGLFAFGLFAVAFTACGDDDSSTDATPTSDSTTSTPPASSDGSVIEVELPEPDSLEPESPSVLARFTWGSGGDSVGFMAPNGEGATAGPAAFTVLEDGTVLVLDNWNGRVLQLAAAEVTERTVELSSPAVQAAFDDVGALAAADSGVLRVFDQRGAELTTMDAGAVMQLEFDDRGVWSRLANTRALLAARQGDTLVAVAEPESEPTPVQVDLEPDHVSVTVRDGSGPASWRLHGSRLRGAQFYDIVDDAVVLVLLLDLPTDSHDDPSTYLVVRLSPERGMRASAIEATTGYLDDGPLFRVDGSHLDVLSSTTSDGVTIARYPLP